MRNKTNIVFLVLMVIVLTAVLYQSCQQKLEVVEDNEQLIMIDSPFGASGSLSRPFIASDNVSREEIWAQIAAESKLYRHAEDLNVSWIRPLDIYWRTVQKNSSGSCDWQEIDIVYGRVPQEVNLLATIDALSWGTNLDYAFEPGTWRFSSVAAENSYINFVRAVVERYDGDGVSDMPGLTKPIKYWQIGNEPGPRPLLATNNSQGSFDWLNYSHLVKISSEAIKQADVTAKIVLAGLMAGYPTPDKLLSRELGEFYLPLINDLSGKYIDYVDIHYYGDGSTDPQTWQWQYVKQLYETVRQSLDRHGFQQTQIWFTETGVPSSPFGEKFQAVNLFKRYIALLVVGVKKIFWWNMIEGAYPLEAVGNPVNHMGLVYDGVGQNDPGYGVKKLAYYTYKKLIEVLSSSDFNNIEIVRNTDGIFIFKFKRHGKSLFAVWNEMNFDRQIIINVNAAQVMITQVVPHYASGKDISDYHKAFSSETMEVQGGQVQINLRDVPLFIETK